VPVVAYATVDVQVKVRLEVAKSPGPPEPTGVRLFTRIETVYNGLVALIVVDEAARTGTISAVTLVPYAA